MVNAKAVIFDMDGVLIDTERIGLEAWLLAADVVGLPFSEGIYRRLIGMRMRDIQGILLEYYTDDSTVENFLEVANEHYRERVNNHPLPIKPGLFEVFDYLDSAGLPRAVATSTSTELATRHMTRLKLIDRIDFLVGGDQVSRSKPEPDIFIRAAELLEMQPRDCLVVEDSEKGIEAAYKSGCIPVLIPDMIEPNEGMRFHASYIYPSLNAFLDALKI